jgi:type II secretory pathway pseudopilin PulG
MHSKNRNGFIMTEAIIAVAIVGLMLVPLIAVQMRVRSSVGRFSDRYDRTLQMNTFLEEMQRTRDPEATEFVFEKKIPYLETNLMYEFKPVPEASALSKLPSLFLEKVTATWRQEGKARKEVLLYFVFKPGLEKAQ